MSSHAQDTPAVRLNPEVVLIDADTEDGTLLEQVTLTYWLAGDVSGPNFGKTAGTVQAEVFDALPVSLHMSIFRKP